MDVHGEDSQGHAILRTDSKGVDASRMLRKHARAAEKAEEEEKLAKENAKKRRRESATATAKADRERVRQSA